MATARNTLAVAIKLDGTAQAKKEFEDVGKAGEKAFAAIARAADKVAPGLGSKLTTAIRGIRNQFLQLQAAGARLAQSFSTFTLAANTFGRALQNSARRIGLVTAAITGAVGAVALFTKRAADNAEHITGQAEALGISAQAYQTFQAAVTNAGLSQETFDQILSRFVTNAADAGDAVGGVSDNANKLAQSMRQVTVTAEDGSQKLITIRGTSEALAKSIKTVGASAQGTEQDVINFAKRIEAAKTAQERFNIVLEAGFAKRIAPQVVRAMLAIARDADPAARAINKILEPTSDADLSALLAVDSAFDRFFLNLVRIKDQIAAAFGPAVAEFLNGLADAISNNQKAIREWADTIAREALVVVRDLFALLRGDDAAVQNRGLIAFRDGVIEVGRQVQNIIVNLIVPAFQKLIGFLDQVATAINSVFGTDFSGQGLAVVAIILQITGAFQILLSLFALGAATVQLFSGALGLLAAALEPLAFALGFVGAALAALLGLPAAVGVAIVAAIAVAAAATFIYWDDIKAGAKAAWDFAALQVEAFANKSAEILGEGGTLDQAWESIKQGSADAWKFATTEAQKFVAFLQTIDLGQVLSLLQTGFDSLFTSILGKAKSFGAGLLSAIGSAIRGIIGLVNDAIAAFQRLFSAQSKSSSSSSSSVSGFKATALSRAGGGIVRGPGTGTSDSILTWLSDGEFVIRASAVKRLGLGLLEALNCGTNALRARGFANGGLVTANGLSFDMPRLSIGPIDDRGPALSSFQPVTIMFGDQRIEGLQATPSAIREIASASVQKRVRSNGRKPGWFGGQS